MYLIPRFPLQPSVSLRLPESSIYRYEIQLDISSSQSPQPSSAGPQLNVHYAVSDFTLLHPDTVRELPQDELEKLALCRVVKISPNVIVKLGPYVDVLEASRSQDDVCCGEYQIPVPTVLACYTYGPLDRDTKYYPSRSGYHTYIFMSFVEGKTLDTAWGSYDAPIKHITGQLASFMQELRDLGEGDYIGSLDRGPVFDDSLQMSPDPGTTSNLEGKE